MASELLQTVERDGEIINIYASGAEYSVTRKCLIRPATNNLISTENTSVYNRRKQELKRERLMMGAAEHLMKGKNTVPDDLDVVQAIGRAAMQRATDTSVKNNKQIDAARFILSESGLSEDKPQPATQNTVNVILIPDNVLRFLQDIKKRLGTETDISESNNSRQELRVVDGAGFSPSDQEPADE